MRLADYKRGARYARWFVTAWPLISEVTGQRFIVPFPPMGDYAAPWGAAATVITGLVGLIPFVYLPRNKRKILGLFVLSIISFFSYLTCSQIFVVPVPRPNGAFKYVTRGSVRRPDLPEPFKSKSDEDVIQDSGQHDGDLEDIYQRWSLQLNRQVLFWTYVAAWGLLQACLGSVSALDHQRANRGRARNEPINP